MRKFLIPICLLLAFTSCSKNNKENADKTFFVSGAIAQSTPQNNTENFAFIAKPFRTSELSFRVGGPVKEMNRFSGDFIRKGEVIARIDPRDFRIRKEKAYAAYLQAEAEYKRQKSLFEQGNISASSYEKANANFLVAKSNYESTGNELNDTELRAPFDGYIQDVMIEVQQEVKASQPAFRFIDMDQLRIEANVSQQVADMYRNTQSVKVSFDSNPNEMFDARIINISRSTTKNNLSFLLTASVDNKDHKLSGGSSGMLHLNKSGESNTCVVLPIKAVVNTPSNGSFVWVYDARGQKVNKQKVETGKLLPGGKLEILSGLSAGDTVAVSGTSRLYENRSVTLNM
ncbi:MAG: efflux RND transporter periplasmic adaptor subunit [Bacteroidales bacterium]